MFTVCCVKCDECAGVEVRGHHSEMALSSSAVCVCVCVCVCVSVVRLNRLLD